MFGPRFGGSAPSEFRHRLQAHPIQVVGRMIALHIATLVSKSFVSMLSENLARSLDVFPSFPDKFMPDRFSDTPSITLMSS